MGRGAGRQQWDGRSGVLRTCASIARFGLRLKKPTSTAPPSTRVTASTTASDVTALVGLLPAATATASMARRARSAAGP